MVVVVVVVVSGICGLVMVRVNASISSSMVWFLIPASDETRRRS